MERSEIEDLIAAKIVQKEEYFHSEVQKMHHAKELAAYTYQTSQQLREIFIVNLDQQKLKELRKYYTVQQSPDYQRSDVFEKVRKLQLNHDLDTLINIRQLNLDTKDGASFARIREAVDRYILHGACTTESTKKRRANTREKPKEQAKAHTTTTQIRQR